MYLLKTMSSWPPQADIRQRIEHDPTTPFANAGSRNFTPSGANKSGEGDWVLVLEAQTVVANSRVSATSRYADESVPCSAFPAITEVERLIQVWIWLSVYKHPRYIRSGNFDETVQQTKGVSLIVEITRGCE